MTQFMGIVIGCLESSGASALWIKSQVEVLGEIARERPDLVERYDRAIALRDGREIERIWFQCCVSNRAIDASLRINGITGRVHFGNGSRSTPLFPLPN
ncbi:hypothetical protein V1279_001855 [Bradyrhizobium sp. AZCC 1610]|uniref:hypothetical protein n=1 Tax=Bradyrhizobium sp. AZCC 1610 TaxID=3117020 RepID=UPI002FF3B1FC